ncbi:MAG: hypothetical protein EBU97_02900 [Rhodobacteraceae bacterium]|nr:hypothetical protein [Paracoccaceae bacterium]
MAADPHSAHIWLDDLARALRRGDLAAMGPLLARADAALAHLPRDAARLRQLRDMAQRNTQLLTAAARGLRAARQRQSDRAMSAQIVTYDAHGQRRELAGDAATLD